MYHTSRAVSVAYLLYSASSGHVVEVVIGLHCPSDAASQPQLCSHLPRDGVTFTNVNDQSIQLQHEFLSLDNRRRTCIEVITS